MSFRLVIIKLFVAVVTLYIFKYYEKTLLLSILTVYCFVVIIIFTNTKFNSLGHELYMFLQKKDKTMWCKN